MQQWARRFGFGAADRARHRRRGGRPAADAGLAQEDVRERLGSRLEPGRLDPARHRPEGPARHAAADGRVLRDARERRERRHAVSRVGRRAAAERRARRASCSAASRRRRRAPAGVDPAALAAVRDGLFRATHSASGTSSGVFGNYPSRSRAKTGTAEKVVPLSGYPAGHLEDQSWWCGWGPSDSAKLVVCALIENGGHGSTAAAPAALRVFERFFNVEAPPASSWTPTDGGARSMIEVTQRPRIRSFAGRAEPALVSFLRSLDWILLAAAAGSSATACGSSRASRASTSRETSSTSSSVRGSPQRSASSGSSSRRSCRSISWRRYWKLVYGATLALMFVVFVAAETDSRLEALARPRRHPVPAFGAREGPVRPRDRRLRRGPRRADHPLADDLHRRSGSAPSRSSSCSCSRTSARRSCTRRRSSQCCSSWASAGGSSSCCLSSAILAITSVLWLLPAAGVQVLKPYQAARLTLDPDADPGGITYNLNQSITAVGSGGLTGRGVIEASQTKLDYLPEHATDFAFASLAEQRGFVGCAILLLLYLLVVWRGLRVITGARRALRRRRRGRARRRVPLPGLRQRRDDDGRRACRRGSHCRSSPSAARRWSRTSC